MKEIEKIEIWSQNMNDTVQLNFDQSNQNHESLFRRRNQETSYLPIIWNVESQDKEEKEATWRGQRSL